MKRCPCCDREAALDAVLSVIDFRTREICATCFDNNAEPKAVVQTAENTGLLASVTVFEGRTYMNAADWFAAAADDELEPDPEDDIDVQTMRSILKLQGRVARSLFSASVRRRPLAFPILWGRT